MFNSASNKELLQHGRGRAVIADGGVKKKDQPIYRQAQVLQLLRVDGSGFEHSEGESEKETQESAP